MLYTRRKPDIPPVYPSEWRSQFAWSETRIGRVVGGTDDVFVRFEWVEVRDTGPLTKEYRVPQGRLTVFGEVYPTGAGYCIVVASK
jgi:hypothetical protein